MTKQELKRMALDTGISSLFISWLPFSMLRYNDFTSCACKKFFENVLNMKARIGLKKSFRPPTSPNIEKKSKAMRFWIVTLSEREM